MASFTYNDFVHQARAFVSAASSIGIDGWRWDERGLIEHHSEVGEYLTGNDDGDASISEENDPTVEREARRRYRLTHHVLFNHAYQVPQIGVVVFDAKANSVIVKEEEVTRVLSTYSGREKPECKDCRSMFISMDEHPLIDDFCMFFVHPCGTSSTIQSVLDGLNSDYLICYLSTYGPDMCCSENWMAIQHALQVTHSQ